MSEGGVRAQAQPNEQGVQEEAWWHGAEMHTIHWCFESPKHGQDLINFTTFFFDYGLNV